MVGAAESTKAAPAEHKEKPMTERHSLGRFREANRYLGDLKQLNAMFDQDGYLFFPGVLEGVDRVRHEFIRVLEKQGAVKAGALEPIWTGMKVDQINDDELYGASSCRELFESGHNIRIFEQIFGEPVFVFKSPTVRYSLPNDNEHVSPPHQDYFFVRINKTFRTFWIPLMDIDEQIGGLAIAPGIHRHGLLDHVEADHVYSYIFRGRKQMGVPLERVGRPWLTADYHPGDLLVFHHLMVHWALPNCSDKIRLSIDNRCQPANAARTWQAERSILEARAFRRTAEGIAREEGASEELFEEIMIELMGRGLEPGRQQIKSLMAELSSGEKIPRVQ
jgi:1-deoxypentalenic acid 11beta-hydroxylase